MSTATESLVTYDRTVLTERVNERHDDEIKRLRERLAKADERRAKDLDTLNAILAAADRLAAEGVHVGEVRSWNTDFLPVTVDRSQLPAVHRALGKLELSGKSLANARQRLVSVSLRPVNLPNITVTYTMKLPRAKRLPDGTVQKPRCRIVRSKQTSFHLQCDI